TTLVTITINGTNDLATISGSSAGTVTESGGTAGSVPGTSQASGDLNATDVDNTNDAWSTATGAASGSGFGTFTIGSTGVWTYTQIGRESSGDRLNATSTLADSFTVSTVDGTTAVVTITIRGTNDQATISGVSTGSVTESGG